MNEARGALFSLPGGWAEGGREGVTLAARLCVGGEWEPLQPPPFYLSYLSAPCTSSPGPRMPRKQFLAGTRNAHRRPATSEEATSHFLWLARKQHLSPANGGASSPSSLPHFPPNIPRLPLPGLGRRRKTLQQPAHPHG